MDPTRNFVKYRNLLRGSDRPLIPYFPVAKKDLTWEMTPWWKIWYVDYDSILYAYNQMLLENYSVYSIMYCFR